MEGDPTYQVEVARPWTAGLAGLLGLGLVMLVYFDLRVALPFNDEWFYRWSITELAAGHGLRLWPGALPPNLVQIAAGSLPLLAHLPVEASRLMVLPFLLAQAALSWWCGRQLGCSRFWAAVAALAVALSPLELAVATGVMSDIAYLAFLAGAAGFGLGWAERGTGRVACITFAVLAALQRQHAAAIPVAMTITLLFAGRLRRPADRWALAALWALVVGALAMPLLTGLATPAVRGLAVATPPIRYAAGAAGVLTLSATLLGLFALPLAVAAWTLAPGERAVRSRWALVPVIAAETGLLTAAIFALRFGNMIFPGDYFGNWGLGPLHLTGPKPAVWPLPVFWLLELAVVAAFLVILGRRRRSWTPASLGVGGVLMTVLAVAHLVPMFATGATDRYYLPVALTLTPVIASRLSLVGAARVSARASAMAAITGGLALYAVAQGDYESWQAARDATAQQAYAFARSYNLGPASVEAGWEEDGLHYLLPTYLATGHAPVYDPAGLPGATIHVMFGVFGDRRPGQDYDSVASGRMVWKGSR